MNVAHLLVGQAGVRGDAPAIVEGPAGAGRSITFAELERRSAQGAALLAESGIGVGDHVLVFVPMSIELYTALIAIFRVGAVAMFLDPSAGREHMMRCCARVAPAGLIATDRAHLLRLTTAALRRIERKFVVGWPVPGARRWSRLERLKPRETIAQRSAEDAALVTFTSGSTGEPKAAVRSHGFLAEQHRVLAETMELAAGQVDLATLPIFTLANLASGVTSVIPDADLRRVGAVKAGPILRQIAAHGVTRCTASPAFFERLLEHRAAPAALGRLRRVDTGGAPVFPGLLRRLAEAMPGATVSAVYGSTEAEPIAHVSWEQVSEVDVAAMLGGAGLLAGRPVEQIELRIVPNRWGEPLGVMTREQLEAMVCAAGEAGEIVVHGRHVLGGYLGGVGDAETKFRVDGAVWHRTGDAGYLDGHGRLWLLGRAGARIEDAGGTVYPFAVECAANAMAGVRRAALVEHRGQRVLVIEPAVGAEAGLAETVAEKAEWAKVQVRLMGQIPVDKRHNAKIDYGELRRRMGAADGRG